MKALLQSEMSILLFGFALLGIELLRLVVLLNKPDGRWRIWHSQFSCELSLFPFNIPRLITLPAHIPQQDLFNLFLQGFLTRE